MVDMQSVMGLTGISSGMFTTGLMGIIVVCFLGFILLVGLTGIGAFLWIHSYNIKVKYWPVYGDSNGKFKIGGAQKQTRMKWNKNKSVWYEIWKSTARVQRPFDMRSIFSGNVCYAYRDERGVYWEAEHIIESGIGGHPAGRIQAITNSQREWDDLAIRKNAEELKKAGKWDTWKPFIFILIIAIFAFAMLAAMAYGAFKTIQVLADKAVLAGKAEVNDCTTSIASLATLCGQIMTSVNSEKPKNVYTIAPQ